MKQIFRINPIKQIKRILLVFVSITALGCGGDVFDTLLEANEVNKDTLYTVTYNSNGADAGDLPAGPVEHASGYTVTVLGNTGSLTFTGYSFDSWNTLSNGTGESYFAGGTFQMPKSDVTLYAIWNINQYTLTYIAGANGTLTGAASQTVNHGSSGTAVTAVPGEGYYFVKWSDDLTANPRTDTNVTADKSVTAQFAIKQYTLTYIAGANGSLTGAASQTVNHGSSGTAVTAVPGEGYYFVKWSDNLTENTRTDTNITANISVTAEFAIYQYTLTYTSGGNGTISGTTVQTVNHGSNGTAVTAVANTGYRFDTWGDGITTAVRQDLNVQSYIYEIAYFVIDTGQKFTLTLTNDGKGTASVSGEFYLTQSINISATPSTGYKFRRWTGNIDKISGFNANIGTLQTLSMPAENVILNAEFEIDQNQKFALTLNNAGNGTASGSGSYYLGQTVPISASPNSGYQFKEWTGDTGKISGFNPAAATQNVSMPAEPVILTATFEPAELQLTLNNDGNGTTSGSGTYYVGQAISISATPAPGYQFKEWIGDTLKIAGLDPNRGKIQNLTMPDESVTLEATFEAVYLVSISVTPESSSLAAGMSRQFYATGFYSDDTTEDLTTQAEWQSTNESIAKVDPLTGFVTAESVTGTVQIEAVFDLKTGSANLTVTGATLDFIYITPLTKTIAAGTKQQFTTTGVFSDNSTQDLTAQATWEESTVGVVASIDPNTGLAVAIDPGKTEITATYSGKTAQAELIVTNAVLNTITITPTDATKIGLGTYQQYKAIGTYSDDTTQDITTLVTWLSYVPDTTDPSPVASISNSAPTNGRATSTGIGTAEIRAELSGKSAKASIQILSLSLEQLNVFPSEDVKIEKGRSFQLTVIGTYNDGTTQDLTTQVTWSSGNTGIATVSNLSGQEGVVTGISADIDSGITTINAKRDGVTGSKSVQVLNDTTPPKMTLLQTVISTNPDQALLSVTFSEPVGLSEALGTNNYRVILNNSLTKSGDLPNNELFLDAVNQGGLMPDSVTFISPSIFQIKVSSTYTASTYAVVVSRDPANGIKDIAGNTLGYPNILTFVGIDTTRPYLVSVTNPEPDVLEATYSEPVKSDGSSSAADNINNYTITRVTIDAGGSHTDLKITSVTVLSSSQYRLQLSEELYADTYRLTVSETVTDLATPTPNPIGEPRELTFIGNERLKVVSAQAITTTSVRVTFNKPVKDNLNSVGSASCSGNTECSSRYTFDPSLGDILSASVGTGVNSSRVTIHTDPDFVNSMGGLGQTGGSYLVIAKNIVAAANNTEELQPQPRDRAPFMGLGKVVSTIEDGSYFEDPFGDATSFSYAFGYGGRVYLGPNDTNSYAFRFDPDGNNPVLVSFAFNPFPGVAPNCPEAVGFGMDIINPTCGNGGLGYYGEKGLVGFDSVKFTDGTNTREILVIGPWKSGVPYAYYTNSKDTTLVLTPMKLVYNGGGNVESIQTVYGFTHGTNHHLYTGITSPASPPQAPQMNYFPVTILNGIVTVDAENPRSINLRQKAFLGAGGTPKNNASIIGVDSMLYHNGYFYVANNGGILYTQDFTAFTVSTQYNPFPVTTPASETLHTNTFGKIRPGQKGVSFMLTHNGKVYLVRNAALSATPTSPERGEVWVCGTSPCGSGNWTKIVAGNESGIHADSKAISLLAFNGDYVYIGFDNTNATQGVQLFRFRHNGGDLPGSFVKGTTEGTHWVQQGVNGLGGNYKYIYSRAVMSDGADNYIYITVGTDADSIKVFRSRD